MGFGDLGKEPELSDASKRFSVHDVNLEPAFDADVRLAMTWMSRDIYPPRQTIQKMASQEGEPLLM
jgi:hypothetical protein